MRKIHEKTHISFRGEDLHFKGFVLSHQGWNSKMISGNMCLGLYFKALKLLTQLLLAKNSRATFQAFSALVLHDNVFQMPGQQ